MQHLRKHRACRVSGNASPLESTFTRMSVSVDSKQHTETLNYLESTLTKNTGEGSGLDSQSWLFSFCFPHYSLLTTHYELPSICNKANCPQAAITSRPREYLVNTGTPLSSKIL